MRESSFFLLTLQIYKGLNHPGWLSASLFKADKRVISFPRPPVLPLSRK